MEEEKFQSVAERGKKKLERDMGDLLLGALYDSKTVDLMVNPDGKVWQERLGERMKCIGTIRATQAEAIIKTVAAYHGKEVTRTSPYVEGEFPLDGSRFSGQLPPIVAAATFDIRKKAVAVFTLEQYVEAGIMTRAQHEVLKRVVREHRNILVLGGTGSGKTTLVNAIIHEMVISNPYERVTILEDLNEVQCAAENFVKYQTSLDVDMTKLLKITLRMRPDRILVGEVRGAEAMDLLDSWNTGHPGGAATIHANDVMGGLTRLSSLVSRNPSAPRFIEPLIGEAVQVVVHIARTSTGRQVQEILEVSGYADGKYITKIL